MSSLALHAANLFDIQLTDEHLAAFDLFTQELIAWNDHTNLTAIIEPEAITIRHYLDSLSIVRVCPMREGLQIIDVGTGAGFPGLPLAMIFPQIQVTLLEATGKKIAFLDHVIARLGLQNAHTVKARAEEAGQLPAHRTIYDVVIARAVARMPALMEYLLPFARVGGRCIAMKGVTAEQETADARQALQILGGQVQRMESIQLPDVSDPHYLVVVDKIDATPKAYPRNPGTPTRKPLI